MTKLEEKLLQLGYRGWFIERDRASYYTKVIDEVEIAISIANNKVGYCDVAPRRNIFKQSQIDNIQQAFNQLQKDLEVLKDES